MKHALTILGIFFVLVAIQSASAYIPISGQNCQAGYRLCGPGCENDWSSGAIWTQPQCIPNSDDCRYDRRATQMCSSGRICIPEGEPDGVSCCTPTVAYAEACQNNCGQAVYSGCSNYNYQCAACQTCDATTVNSRCQTPSGAVASRYYCDSQTICRACQAGQVWNGNSCVGCVDNMNGDGCCQGNQENFATRPNECKVVISCPPNYRWDSTAAKCVLLRCGEAGSTQHVYCDSLQSPPMNGAFNGYCTSDQYWPVCCAKGSYWDTSRAQCRPASACAPAGTIDGNSACCGPYNDFGYSNWNTTKQIVTY